MQTGATVWARQTITSDVFGKPDKWFKIWFYLVNRVNHKDKGRFKRGTGFMTYEMIMLATGATKSEVDHCIRWLKKCQMLATARATRGLHITILNYELYQNLKNYKSDDKSDSEAIQKRHDKQVCKNVSNNIKKAYGENFKNVLLTDDEHRKLFEKFDNAADWIERLDIALHQKDYKYKSHYATILAWSRKDERQTVLQKSGPDNGKRGKGCTDAEADLYENAAQA